MREALYWFPIGETGWIQDPPTVGRTAMVGTAPGYIKEICVTVISQPAWSPITSFSLYALLQPANS